MASWLDEIGRQVREVVGTFWNEVGPENLLPLLRPVAPFDRRFVAPAATVGGLLAFMLLSGVAVTALGVLLLALLALYLLLIDVFGVSIELHPFGLR